MGRKPVLLSKSELDLLRMGLEQAIADEIYVPEDMGCAVALARYLAVESRMVGREGE